MHTGAEINHTSNKAQVYNKHSNKYRVCKYLWQKSLCIKILESSCTHCQKMKFKNEYDKYYSSNSKRNNHMTSHLSVKYRHRPCIKIDNPLVVYRYSCKCKVMKWCQWQRRIFFAISRRFHTNNAITKIILKSYDKYNLTFVLLYYWIY